MNNIKIGKISFSDAMNKLDVDFSELREILNELSVYSSSEDHMMKLLVAIKKLIKRIDTVNEIDQDILILRNTVMFIVEKIESNE